MSVPWLDSFPILNDIFDEIGGDINKCDFFFDIE